ncbi:ATP/GTP-binding protein [Desulfothermus naphthae]
MFVEFMLKNFANHKNTIIKLFGPVVLLIGANSSGKTNLLKGIHFMSKIVSRARPLQKQSDSNEEEMRTRIKPKEFRTFYYRWAKGEPMELSCKWKDARDNKILYSFKIFEKNNQILGKEALIVKINNAEEKIFETKESESLNLRLKIQNENLEKNYMQVINAFFADLASIYFFHFQPSALKGLIKQETLLKKDNVLLLPGALGPAGENFPEIVEYVRDNEKKVYDKMVSFLRIIDEKFESARVEKGKLRWFYKPEKHIPRLYNFTTDQVSDGFIKAAVIALLISLDRSPSMILLEEIENGINPLNIRQLLKWLYQAVGTSNSIARGYITQFILTTHSPIVLREFADNLKCVYSLRRMDKEFLSIVKNLEEVIRTFVEVGTIEGELTEESVKISKEQLESLWLEGLIG